MWMYDFKTEIQHDYVSAYLNMGLSDTGVRKNASNNCGITFSSEIANRLVRQWMDLVVYNLSFELSKVFLK